MTQAGFTPAGARGIARPHWPLFPPSVGIRIVGCVSSPIPSSDQAGRASGPGETAPRRPAGDREACDHEALRPVSRQVMIGARSRQPIALNCLPRILPRDERADIHLRLRSRQTPWCCVAPAAQRVSWPAPSGCHHRSTRDCPGVNPKRADCPDRREHGTAHRLVAPTGGVARAGGPNRGSPRPYGLGRGAGGGRATPWRAR